MGHSTSRESINLSMKHRTSDNIVDMVALSVLLHWVKMI